MSKQTGPERVAEIVEILKTWQGLERHAINDTTEIIENTPSPLVRMIMEIIRHDSNMHHRVQQFLIDSLTVADVPVSREDVASIWDKIEAHDRTEKRTIELAKQLREKAWSPVHKQLLDYLLVDEEKHDGLLAGLATVKGGMDRASGG